MSDALQKRKMSGKAEQKEELKKQDLAPEVEDTPQGQGFDANALIQMMQEKGMNPEMLMKMMQGGEQNRAPAIDPMRSPAIEEAPEMNRAPANSMESFVSQSEAQNLMNSEQKPKSLLERAQMAFLKKK